MKNSGFAIFHLKKNLETLQSETKELREFACKLCKESGLDRVCGECIIFKYNK